MMTKMMVTLVMTMVLMLTMVLLVTSVMLLIMMLLMAMTMMLMTVLMLTTTFSEAFLAPTLCQVFQPIVIRLTLTTPYVMGPLLSLFYN